jgi:hypothetical protein
MRVAGSRTARGLGLRAHDILNSKTPPIGADGLYLRFGTATSMPWVAEHRDSSFPDPGLAQVGCPISVVSATAGVLAAAASDVGALGGSIVAAVPALTAASLTAIAAASLLARLSGFRRIAYPIIFAAYAFVPAAVILLTVWSDVGRSLTPLLWTLTIAAWGWWAIGDILRTRRQRYPTSAPTPVAPLMDDSRVASILERAGRLTRRELHDLRRARGRQVRATMPRPRAQSRLLEIEDDSRRLAGPGTTLIIRDAVRTALGRAAESSTGRGGRLALWLLRRMVRRSVEDAVLAVALSDHLDAEARSLLAACWDDVTA